MKKPTRGLRSKALATLLAGVLAVARGAAPALADPPRDDAHYRAGIGLLNKGVYDLAASELEAYLRENPGGEDTLSARYALGVSYARLGRYADASKELDHVITSGGFEFAPDAALLRARCAMAGGDDAGAAALLATLLHDHPDFAGCDHAASLRGEALFRAGKFDEACAALAAFGASWPKSDELDRADLFHAMAESALGRTGEAANRAADLRRRSPAGPCAASAALVEARCRHARGELDEAQTLYRAAADSHDPSVRDDAALGGAQVARARGDLGEAQRLLDELDARGAPAALLGAASLERGRLLYDCGRFEDAMLAFEGLAVAASGVPADHAAYWCGRCEVALGRAQAAAERLERAVSRFPRSELLPEMLFDRAAALSRAGNDNAAVEALTAWESRFKSHALAPDAVAARALALHRLGRVDESLKACGEFSTSWPRHARAPAIALLVGENEFMSGRFARAESAYRGYLAAHPDDPGAWRAKVRQGVSLARLQRADDAARILEDALAERGEHDADLFSAAVAELGAMAFDAGDWRSGERWYASLAPQLEGRPGVAECVLRLALCIARQGRGAEAVASLEHAEKLGAGTPTARHARFERAQVLAGLGENEAARVAFESIAGDSAGTPDELSPLARRHLAAIASREGRHGDAAAILASASDGSADSMMQQAAAWMSVGRFDEAERAYARASEIPGPRSGEARARGAIAVNRQGRHEESIEELERAEDAPSPLDQDTLSAVRYERALAFRAMGRNEPARAAYRAVLDGHPPAALAAYSALDLAQLEMGDGEHGTALALLDRCRESLSLLESGDASAVSERETYLRGACLLAMGKPAEAAAALATFRERFPRSELAAHAALALGAAQLKSGSVTDAAATLKSVAGTDTPAEVAGPALIKLGDSYAAMQRWSEAESAYTANLDRFGGGPAWYQARFGQGWCREQQGRHDAAIEAYREVASRHDGPTGARAQFQIGECLYAMKRHAEAVAELLKTDVLFAHPEWSAAAVYEAGRCLAEMGRAADAARQFEDVTKRFPDSKWATLAKERLAAARPATLPGRASAAPGPG